MSGPLGNAPADAVRIRVQPPAVVIETAFLVAGLPEDRRQEAVERIAGAVSSAGSSPAFAGLVEGVPTIGLDRDELRSLAARGSKAGTRDLAAAAARHDWAGTTVSATLFLAHRAGFTVAATGGIGGVHPRPGPPDVSADLIELGRRPAILVCSGVKAFLDDTATFERLETLGVTVLGFGTDRLPGFWTADGGRPVPPVEDAAELASIWSAARRLETPGAFLVCVPPPSEHALEAKESERAIGRALLDLETRGITGGAVTPFLLARIAEYTEGRSIEANLALLENNARVAAEISRECRM